MPDLGRLNLTQKLATKASDCSGLKVSEVSEVTVPMVIISDVTAVGLPRDRQDLYSLCQQALSQHPLRGELCGRCRTCIVSVFREPSFWWDPEGSTYLK